MTLPQKPKFQYHQPVVWHETYYLTELGDYMSESEWINALLDCANGQCYEAQCIQCNNCCRIMSAIRIDEDYRGFIVSRHFPDPDEILFGRDPEWTYEVQLTSLERWCPNYEEIDLDSLDTTIVDVTESDLRAVFQPKHREGNAPQGVVRLQPNQFTGDIDYLPVAFLLTMRLTHTPEEITKSVESPSQYDPIAVFLEHEDHTSIPRLSE